MSFLNNIQSWPEHKKKRVWFFSTVLITAVIFLGWLSTLNSDFLNAGGTEESSKTENNASVTSALGRAFGNFWGDLQSDLNDLKGNFGF